MENIVGKEQMDAIKALSDVNVKVSEATNLLFKLQEEETEYLVEREKKALIKINKILQDSNDLIQQARGNYQNVKNFSGKLSEYADFLSDAHSKFQEMVELFKAKRELWDKNATLQIEEIAKQRKMVEQDAKALEAREKSVQEASQELKKQREHIESQQATLLVSYKAEKDLWNKLQKT